MYTYSMRTQYYTILAYTYKYIELLSFSKETELMSYQNSNAKKFLTSIAMLLSDRVMKYAS